MASTNDKREISATSTIRVKIAGQEFDLSKAEATRLRDSLTKELNDEKPFPDYKPVPCPYPVPAWPRYYERPWVRDLEVIYGGSTGDPIRPLPPATCRADGIAYGGGTLQ